MIGPTPIAGRIADRLAGRTRTEPVPVDVTDRGDAFEVAIDLPGVRKQDLDVTVHGNRVQVVAEPPDAELSGEYLRRERTREPMRRVVELPEDVDERRASASYEDGVLWLTLRKRDR